MSVAPLLQPPDASRRGLGCSDQCRSVDAFLPGRLGRSRLWLHDAESHEQHGFEIGSSSGFKGGDLMTGPLTLRLGTFRAYVGRHPIHPTPTEFQLLACLGRRLGLIVRYADIVQEVWGRAWSGQVKADSHLIRVNVARMRKKLGPAAYLIETRQGLGYCLRDEPYTGPGIENLDPVIWGGGVAACLGCQRTDRRHARNGYCRRCHQAFTTSKGGAS